MKFKQGDKLTWKLFQEGCAEIENRCNKQILNEEENCMPQMFHTYEECVEYFKGKGYLTIDEFNNKMKEKYNS